MRREFYPTTKELKTMGLSDYQINELIELENKKHNFRDQYIHNNHFSAPNSIFFLDIKDTLYHSCGHGSNGVLGRAGDSLPLFTRDILSLGALLDRTTGQTFTMSFYNLCDDQKAIIEYDFPLDITNSKYKMDIPFNQIKESFTGRKLNRSNEGPYKLVFVSSDSVETQKDIILFLLLIYKIYMSASVLFRIDSQRILKLEQLFEQSNCNYDVFVSNLPTEYSKVFNNLFDKNKIETIINNITFLSTKDSNLTKVELMQSFLDRYNIENGLCYDDYNIFACGDDYFQDGPMIKLAFQLGGYGCINSYSFHYNSDGETIRKELFDCYGIETRIPIASYGFNDFYNKAMDYNSLQRTWDLAETMQDVNSKDESLILNRFKKTNHYIKVKMKV